MKVRRAKLGRAHPRVAKQPCSSAPWQFARRRPVVPFFAPPSTSVMASGDSGRRQHEDPRLSFSTPEFKEAQRIFTDNLKARELLESWW